MPSVGVDHSFWKSRDGILKTVEFMISLLILILTAISNYDEVYYVKSYGILRTKQMAFVFFVASFCCISLFISAMIYLLKLYNLPFCQRLPWRKMEMVFKFTCSVLNFFAMTVAANSAVGTSGLDVRNITIYPDFYELFTTVAIFATIACIIFGMHGLLFYRGYLPTSETPQRRGYETYVANYA